MLIVESQIIWILAGILGLCIGSFLNVVIYRLPLEKSLIRPARSYCPKCNKQIAWYDNIPLISYLFLLGRCRHCKEGIPFRYPLVELTALGLSLAAYAHYQDTVHYLIYFCLFVAPLIAVIFIDLDHRIIPNSITFPGIAIGLLVHYWDAPFAYEKEALLDSLIGIAVGGGSLFLIAWLYEKIKKREGLGGGDVKLAMMFGSFLGWQSVLMILLMGSLLGSLIGVVVIALKRDWYFQLPFGPFLVLAAYLQLFFGRPILNWYLSLLK